MDNTTSNTYGFPPGTVVPTLGNFGVSRIDILNNELSSGYYSNNLDIAALTREIGRVTSGKTGDMNASSTAAPAKTEDSPSWYKSFMDGLKAVSSAPSDYIGKALGSAAADSAKPSSGGIVDSIKQFFAESSVTIAAVVVGIILLMGAFFIYRK